jgi:CheY-like chemotaxis protein
VLVDISRLSFLVMEPAAVRAQAMAQQLRALGAPSVRTAATSDDALAAMRQQRVDVVLAAWDSATEHGLALLHDLRGDPQLRDVALVMVTGRAEPAQVEQAIANGVSALLVKPYTRDQLQSKILASLGARQGFAELPPPAPVQPPPSLLVVDDTPDALSVIAGIFRDRYRVRVATTGEHALEVCAADVPPDLVLLDVMMPGLDGFEVARRMREHPNTEQVPIIFVTALTDDAARRFGLALGAVDFVSKPIDPDLLRLRVDNFMRTVMRHKQRQAECDALLAAARLRQDVDDMLRHDLKNPLAGAVGFARLLALDPALTEGQARRVHLIADAVMQALDIVNLSAEVFKIETGRHELETGPVPLAEILNHTVELARSAFAAKGLEIAFDCPMSAGAAPPFALGDSTLCRSIFHNLVRNACEAAPKGTRVSIQLFDEAPLRVAVHNHGTVPPAIRRDFFERHVTSGKRGGSGLGTYSARLLTEAQGGRIAMRTSDESDSTTVEVVLPRWASEVVQPQP